MAFEEPVSRRTFMAVTGAAAAATVLEGSAFADAKAPGRRRIALVGTGIRGTTMWGTGIVNKYKDVIEFVGLCDLNPLRAEAGKKKLGVSCPTFTDVDVMLDTVKPDALIVTTVCAEHAGCIVKALDRGIDVITEKPMVTDEKQCQAVLDAEKRNKKNIVVTFNYRFAPKHQKIKEVLLAGEIGTVSSVDFSWYLDNVHGADYFRRWHRLEERSGSLWVHKATHHFDLINWWLDADPVEVRAFGDLHQYGSKGPFRSTNCRPCPHKDKCSYYWDITTKPELVELYVNTEKGDGYLRDGCVYKEDVNIADTMNAVVRYSNGVNMSYSLNAFMPIEGYRLAFNGTKGRLEIRDFERQPWPAPAETEISLIRSFPGKVEKIEIPKAEGGHGGGDDVMRDIIFRKTQVPDYMKLPGSRAGALSCLTGVAARQSARQGRPVKISDLIQL
jgi:predicted dehydrogenase